MQFTRSTRYTAVFAVFLTLVLSAGCASKGGSSAEEAPATAASSGPKLLGAGKSIGDVSITLDETALAADVVPVAEQFSVASKLDTALRERKEFDGGALKVDARVVSMRLRSVGNAMALGLASGVDWIAIKVSVSENGAVVKEFEEKSTNSLGGFAYGGREKRVDRMIRDLTNRIIKQM